MSEIQILEVNGRDIFPWPGSIPTISDWKIKLLPHSNSENVTLDVDGDEFTVNIDELIDALLEVKKE